MTTPTDALWNALVSRIECDGGVMHRSSFDEVVAAFVEPFDVGRVQAAQNQQNQQNAQDQARYNRINQFVEPARTPIAQIAATASLLAKAKALHALVRGEVPETPPPAGVFKVGDCVTIPRAKLNDAAWCAFAKHGRWIFDTSDDDKAVFRRIA